MKLRAVAIAAAFAGGILLGRPPVRFATFPPASIPCRAIAITFLLGLFFAIKRWLSPAALCSFAAWVVLGFLAVCLAHQPLPPTHILTRLSAGEVDLHAPSPARLRAEPPKPLGLWPRYRPDRR